MVASAPAGTGVELRRADRPRPHHRHLSGQLARSRGAGLESAARPVQRRASGHPGGTPGHARRRRPAASALRPVAQRPAPAIPTFSSWTPSGPRSSPRPAGSFRWTVSGPTPQLFSLDHPGQPVAGHAVCASLVRGCRACSTGAPIWCPRAPTTLAELVSVAKRARQQHGCRYGLVWQGARYEGLITIFLEYLGAYGGQILEGGRVVVNSEAGRAGADRDAGRDLPRRDRAVGGADLARGGDPLCLPERRGGLHAELALRRALMRDSAASRVAGRFSVAPMPAGAGRRVRRRRWAAPSSPSTATPSIPRRPGR